VVARKSYARLSPEEIDEVWVRLKTGQAAKVTARQLGLPSSTLRTYLVRCGGVRPVPRHRRAGRLSLEDREEVSRGLAAGLSLRAIAVGLGRACSTISREVAANGGRRRYRATAADRAAWAGVLSSRTPSAAHAPRSACVSIPLPATG
jgi:hypothetical protein